MHERVDDARSDESRPAAVGYAPSTFHVTRRRWRVLFALVLLNTAMLAWVLAGSGVTQAIRSEWQSMEMRRIQRTYHRQQFAAQQQCLDYTMRPNEVVYVEDPATALRLMSEEAAFNPVSVVVRSSSSVSLPWTPPAQRAAVPKCLTDLNARRGPPSDIGPAPYDGPLLFLGRRTTPGGVTMLVIVSFEASPELWGEAPPQPSRVETERVIKTYMLQPGNADEPPVEVAAHRLHLALPPTQARPNDEAKGWQVTHPVFLTMLAGRADPAKPSHFVLPYTINGVPGEFDGWLQEEGIVLKGRAGEPVVDVEGRLGWRLPVSPATQPATRP
jgi:hypothetical protein